VTIAGTVTLTNAEVLSGIAILQTLVPGARTFRLDYPVTIDLQTGAMNPIWGAEETYAQMCSTQIARRYGLPSAATCMAIGGKTPDWQAGVQSMLMSFANMVMPADMLNGAGALQGSTVFSPAELLLDCEIFDIATRWAEGYSFDDEHLAVDTIVEVGPGGHFLDSPHTLAHMREIWRTSFMDKLSWDAWEIGGRPDPHAAATSKARELLTSHEPEPLPEDVAAELGRIVASHEREALERAN
jgi:trimethylamine--corrinoid protein Co-methyltransferase